jgi:hypothetical protein
MAIISDKPIKVRDGTVYAECGHGAIEGLKESREWSNFSSRVITLEKEWVQQIQLLAQQWRDSRGYFVPDKDIVADRLSTLKRIASSLANLVDDIEGNSKQKPKGTFFISYSHKDTAIADRITSDLREKGYDVWRDIEQIHVGESIRQALEAGIEHSTFLLVLLSKNSVTSSWVHDEIDMAVTLEKEEKQIILLPVILEKCKIPRLIKSRKWVSLENYEKGFGELMSGLPNSKRRG